ncbi:PucR family transcriptional regulator [Paenibacillus sp. y28]|uniref:PucR family transcriptional regulator n=1 Tax=Paenibacillus sp. y28 TaxID=3129110 RepID=UPI003016F6E0
MNWDRMKSQLENALHKQVRPLTMPQSDWKRLSEAEGTEQETAFTVLREDERLFLLNIEGIYIHCLASAAAGWTESEIGLMKLLLQSWRGEEPKVGLPASEDERKAVYIRNWIEQQLAQGMTSGEMPETLSNQMSLYISKIPLLLYGDFSDQRKVSYQELKKLLASFFDSDIVLIPLKEKEWLLLCSEQMIRDSFSSDRTTEEETMEEVLESIASGLYEMMGSEGIGECHLAVGYPIVPAQSLLSMVIQLRETVLLGRKFHLGSHVHLPWMLHLERILIPLAEADKTRFVESVFKGVDHVLDTETITTLEYFFELDCNVSETAKRLYIHRNTLLYRLDKFKQETGLDVRTFRHAVLVNIALLLYKVTKRQ